MNAGNLHCSRIIIWIFLSILDRNIAITNQNRKFFIKVFLTVISRCLGNISPNFNKSIPHNRQQVFYLFFRSIRRKQDPSHLILCTVILFFCQALMFHHCFFKYLFQVFLSNRFIVQSQLSISIYFYDMRLSLPNLIFQLRILRRTIIICLHFIINKLEDILIFSGF